MLQTIIESEDVSLRFFTKGAVIVAISIFIESIYLVYACFALLAITAYLSIRKLDIADQQIEQSFIENEKVIF